MKEELHKGVNCCALNFYGIVFPICKSVFTTIEIFVGKIESAGESYLAVDDYDFTVVTVIEVC